MSMDDAAAAASSSSKGAARKGEPRDWSSIPPRTLIIDHHDSYTLNLLPLMLHALQPDSATTTAPSEADASLLSYRLLVLPHTHALLEPAAFAAHLAPHLDALILSPGPGNPQREADFGPASKLIQAGALVMDLPTLGVCLGHQGIATALGGSVKRARGIRHGVTSGLCWSESGEGGEGKGLFEGVPEGAKVVRYNSLTVDEQTLPSCLRVTAWASDPICSAPAPHPSAHAQLSSAALPPSSTASHASTSSSTSERVILALQHTSRPLWGVQFHPESIESTYGAVMLRNFLRETRRYWNELAQRGQEGAASRVRAWDEARSLPEHLRRLGGACVAQSLASPIPPELGAASGSGFEFRVVERRFSLKLDAAAAPDVFSRLFRSQGAGSVWLDSARRCDPANRFSYMASPCFSLSYAAQEQRVYVKVPRRGDAKVAPACIELNDGKSGLMTPSTSRGASPTHDEETEAQSGPTFWTWFDELQGDLARRTERIAREDERFCAGWTGYFGYELGAEAMGLPRCSSSAPSSAAPASGTFTPPLEAPAYPLEDAVNEPLPDAHFGFCERVLTLDHQSGEWIATALIKQQGSSSDCSPEYKSLQGALGEMLAVDALRQTVEQAQRWFDEVEAALSELASSFSAEASRAPKAPRLSTATPAASPPSTCASEAGLLALAQLKPRDSPSLYRAKVEAARAHIAQGESYELCLTTQFQGQLAPLSTESSDGDLDHFALYCALRRKNPAPYSAFLSLEAPTPGMRGQSLLSTSPERFMSVSKAGWVEMKPIKGTLARAGWGKGEEQMRAGGSEGAVSEREKAEWRVRTDEERAESLRADVKERAENLMIVDLIRADLLSFCAAHTVSVPRLMQVETYETVHQLVTTVRGRIAHRLPTSSSSSPLDSTNTGATGTVEAIRRCFPPGSMTGAPKRRSVQILAKLEAERGEGVASSSTGTTNAKRGVYSGALGWIGLDGAASFSVVIRTVVANGSRLSLGAGGAVTYLSSAQREWEEVGDKVAAFGVPKF